MNKTELAAEIANRAGADKATVTKVLDGFADVVGANVKKGDKVTIPGFLSFSRVDRKARKARMPGTGEVIRVKASKSVKVSPGLTLKRVVNGEAPATKPASARAAASNKLAAPKAATARAKTAKATAPANPAPPRAATAKAAKTPKKVAR